jgi:hypothetical protein
MACKSRLVNPETVLLLVDGIGRAMTFWHLVELDRNCLLALFCLVHVQPSTVGSLHAVVDKVYIADIDLPLHPEDITVAGKLTFGDFFSRFSSD